MGRRTAVALVAVALAITAAAAGAGVALADGGQRKAEQQARSDVRAAFERVRRCMEREGVGVGTLAGSAGLGLGDLARLGFAAEACRKELDAAATAVRRSMEKLRVRLDGEAERFAACVDRRGLGAGTLLGALRGREAARTALRDTLQGCAGLG